PFPTTRHALFSLPTRRPPPPTPFPYTTLFRSPGDAPPGPRAGTAIPERRQPTRRSRPGNHHTQMLTQGTGAALPICRSAGRWVRSEEHTSELQSRGHLVCRLLLEKKKESDQRV